MFKYYHWCISKELTVEDAEQILKIAEVFEAEKVTRYHIHPSLWIQSVPNMEGAYLGIDNAVPYAIVKNEQGENIGFIQL